MGDITLFDRLPDSVVPEPGWVVPEPEQLDSVMRPVEHEDSVMRPVECLLLPTQTDNSNDNNESVTSQISDDGSDMIPVDEYIKQYLMKDGICILKNSTNKTFDYNQDFYTRDLFESMNEKWKSQVMIFFQSIAKWKWMDLLIGIYGLKSCSVMRLLISVRDLSMMKTEIAKHNILIHYISTNSWN